MPRTPHIEHRFTATRIGGAAAAAAFAIARAVA